MGTTLHQVTRICDTKLNKRGLTSTWANQVLHIQTQRFQAIVECLWEFIAGGYCETFASVTSSCVFAAQSGGGGANASGTANQQAQSQVVQLQTGQGQTPIQLVQQVVTANGEIQNLPVSTRR